MAGIDRLVEKKVKFLGSWVNDEVTKDVTGKILQLIQSKKGSKLKLQLNLDGLRVMKNKIISGMVLQNFIPLENIYFLTVNQNVPCILFVVSTDMHTYQICTFKCENALDAKMFIQGFRDITNTEYSVTKKEHGVVNWTLRSKTKGNKRQLNKLVDIYGEKAVVQINCGDVHQSPASTGHGFQNQNEKTQPGQQFHKTVVKVAKPVLTTITSETNTKIAEVNTKTCTLSNGTTFCDSALEGSKNALHSEPKVYSNELRDIKLMLEKSTGINPDDMNKHNNENPFDAIAVLDNDEEIDTNTEFARRSSDVLTLPCVNEVLL